MRSFRKMVYTRRRQTRGHRMATRGRRAFRERGMQGGMPVRRMDVLGALFQRYGDHPLYDRNLIGQMGRRMHKRYWRYSRNKNYYR